ncbi:MAG: gamma carbonic anhydrase family protein [Gammaproteobacteria bacterium]|nr:gamma carbonic anhydrase family protein [Gammaproteobacteria bacterium]
MLYALGERRPQLLGESHYLAPGSAVIGSAVLHEGVSVWFNAVIRADNDLIEVGEGTNIQDGAVLHTDPGIPLIVGRNVTIGHKAMLHGCRIGDNSLIGINAVVLNGAIIGRNCLIGANSLITEGKVIPDGSLVMGSPGKVVRSLSEDEIAALAKPAQSYQAKRDRYRDELRSL